MNIDKIKVSDLDILTVKKDIKNIHLGVYPPNGRVRVAAPLKTSDEAIRLLVLSKMPWIKKQRSKFSKQERETKREYVSGESHYFWGKRYRLNVIYGKFNPRIEVKKDKIDLYVKPGATNQTRGNILDKFYRTELRKHILVLLSKWEFRIGINLNEVKIKKMKTKWGTSNPKDGRVWINIELAKKPPHCLEYVLAHEMAHFIEKNHTERFRQIMDLLMPQWKQYKEELNSSILGHATWVC